MATGREIDEYCDFEGMIGYRHEETEKPAKPPRKKTDLKVVSELRKDEIRRLVFETIAENGGYDWHHDRIDADTVGFLLDEQHDVEHLWLEANWDSLEEEAYQRIERELQHERAERELSVPLIGR
jgi:hypothetical protein